MIRWPYELVSYTTREVNTYCSNDELWQQFRLTLKGLSTERKLDKLFVRHESNKLFDETSEDMRRHAVQEANYINALKRGGQLTMDLEVQR
jgi:hypothetical protein